MTDLGTANLVLAGLYAVEEVLLVVVAAVKVDFIGRYFVRPQRLRLGVQLAAGDKNPSFAALETGAAAARREHQLDAVGVGIFDIRLRCGGEQPGRWKFPFALDFYGPGIVGLFA